MNSIVASLLPSSATRVVVYLQPISMRYGDVRLRQLCREQLGIEPEPSTAFLFTNQKRDCLLLYSASSTGDRTLLKKLERGAFLLPAPEHDGKPYVLMKPAVLTRLFRSASV